MKSAMRSHLDWADKCRVGVGVRVEAKVRDPKLVSALDGPTAGCEESYAWQRVSLSPTPLAAALMGYVTIDYRTHEQIGVCAAGV